MDGSLAIGSDAPDANTARYGVATELVINGPAWEAGVRPQLVDGAGKMAVSGFRRVSPDRPGLLAVDRLAMADELPSGTSRPPLDDLCVLQVESASTHEWSACNLIRRIAPVGAQSLVALVIRMGGESCEWDGAVRLPDGAIMPIDRVRVAGPGLLTLDRHAEADESTEDEAERWSRVIGAIGSVVFHRLRALDITLVGAGRTGSLMAAELAALGVRRLRVVDPDLIERGNLDGVPLFKPSVVGQAKVRALGRRLLAGRPDLRLSCLARSLLDPSTIETLRALPTEVLVTCVDRDAPRLAASLLAAAALLPHLDIGTRIRRGERGSNPRDEIAADVRLLLPRQGCTRCVGGYADEEATLYELAAPPGTLRRGEPQVWSQERSGSLVSLNSLAVGAGVQMLLDLLSGAAKTSRWQRLAWRSGEGLSSEAAAVTAQAGCAICQA